MREKLSIFRSNIERVFPIKIEKREYTKNMVLVTRMLPDNTERPEYVEKSRFIFLLIKDPNVAEFMIGGKNCVLIGRNERSYLAPEFEENKREYQLLLEDISGEKSSDIFKKLQNLSKK